MSAAVAAEPQAGPALGREPLQFTPTHLCGLWEMPVCGWAECRHGFARALWPVRQRTARWDPGAGVGTPAECLPVGGEW